MRARERRPAGAAGWILRREQRLVGVDVADARDDALVEDRGLDRRLAARERAGQVGGRPLAERLGAELAGEPGLGAVLGDAPGAEAARVGVGEIGAVVEQRPRAQEARIGSSGGSASHSRLPVMRRCTSSAAPSSSTAIRYLPRRPSVSMRMPCSRAATASGGSGSVRRWSRISTSASVRPLRCGSSRRRTVSTSGSSGISRSSRAGAAGARPAPSAISYAASTSATAPRACAARARVHVRERLAGGHRRRRAWRARRSRRRGRSDPPCARAPRPGASRRGRSRARRSARPSPPAAPRRRRRRARSRAPPTAARPRRGCAALGLHELLERAQRRAGGDRLLGQPAALEEVDAEVGEHGHARGRAEHELAEVDRARARPASRRPRRPRARCPPRRRAARPSPSARTPSGGPRARRCRACAPRARAPSRGRA